MSAPYYQDDLVTLYHGDCREVRGWLDADVLLTDPPYGVSMATLRRNRNVPAVTGEAWTGLDSRRTVPAEHVRLRDEALELWGDRPALVFGSWRAPRPSGTRMRLIWDKGYLFPGGVAPFRPVDEEIYVHGAWPNPKNRKGSNVPSIIRVPAYAPATRKRPKHPTAKPPALFAELLRHLPLGVVADPFAGSGPLALAAREAGRRVILVEFEERYCELIATRLSEQVAA